MEIGPGPGIVTDILRKQEVRVTTLDYADDVGADVVGSVLELPFADGEFDVVLCCQVLEHLEFKYFDQALANISKVANRGAVISLPHFGRMWRYHFHVPKLNMVSFGVDLQFIKKQHIFKGQHYWEIGKKGFPVSRIKEHMNKYFNSVTDVRLLDNPYHHFFSCHK